MRRASRSGSTHIAVDVALGSALVVAVLAAVVVDLVRGKPAAATPQEPPTTTTVSTPVEEPPPPEIKPQRLGVTPEIPEYDDMGKLLTTLGDLYKYRSFPLEELIDPGKLDDYDVVFLTCSGYGPRWLAEQTGTGLRGVEQYRPNREVFARAAGHLRQFVERGGTLYASDLHFPLVAAAFPEQAQSDAPYARKSESLRADVVEEGLRERLGSSVELLFDQDGWRPAAFSGEKVETLLRGSYTDDKGREQSGPLAVRFRVGEGTVIFTAFHNEKVNNHTATTLLKYLVLVSVTAREQSRVQQQLTQASFSPRKQGLFSTSSGSPSVTQSYRHEKAGDLRFVLAFQSAGARLKLTIAGPDGKTVAEREGASSFEVDVPAAPPGEYRYTVTALSSPSENFPFTVTVGAK